MRYTFSITAGSLKVPESRVIAGLMLQGSSGRAFQQAISRENVLKARTESTGEGLAKLSRRRLEQSLVPGTSSRTGLNKTFATRQESTDPESGATHE